MEERKEECRGEREEKGCEGLGETLLGNGAVCVEDAYTARLDTLTGAGASRNDDVQKKRPFQIFRSSMVVKVRPEQR